MTACHSGRGQVQLNIYLPTTGSANLLNLGDKKFTDVVPDSLGNCSNVGFLDLSRSQAICHYGVDTTMGSRLIISQQIVSGCNRIHPFLFLFYLSRLSNWKVAFCREGCPRPHAQKFDEPFKMSCLPCQICANLAHIISSLVLPLKWRQSCETSYMYLRVRSDCPHVWPARPVCLPKERKLGVHLIDPSLIWNPILSCPRHILWMWQKPASFPTHSMILVRFGWYLWRSFLQLRRK